MKCKCETPYFEGELVPKTCKNWKMSSKKIFLSGLVTKLENLLVFGKNLWKISSNGWIKKMWLTDLTSAQTLKVCFMVLRIFSNHKRNQSNEKVLCEFRFLQPWVTIPRWSPVNYIPLTKSMALFLILSTSPSRPLAWLQTIAAGSLCHASILLDTHSIAPNCSAL